MSKKNQQVAFGIDELVAKLQTEGVEEAQKQSAKLLADAEQQAKAILAKAQYQRDQLLAKARQQINTERQAAQDDLKISYRDMVLDLKNHLLSRFAQDVERLVSQSLQSEQLIEKLVLAAGHKILQQAEIDTDDQLEITLPENVLELDDIIKDPALGESGELAQFVFAQQRRLLEQGVTFNRGRKDLTGIKISLQGKQISVDLSDQAIAGMLLTYINPRFRALLDGIIH